MIRRAPLILPGGEQFVDAIIGIRSWRAVPAQGHVTLSSVYKAAVTWPHGRPLQSECRCNFVCTSNCGIYAWSDDLAQVEPLPVPYWQTPGNLVHGEVYLWGKVERWPYGYKAEYAMPAGFFLSTDPLSHTLATLAADAWDLPLLAMPELPSAEPIIPDAPFSLSARDAAENVLRQYRAH